MACWVITGASRGIGFELVRQLLAHGENVKGVVRSIDGSEKLKRLREKYPELLDIEEADVASDTSVAALASRFGPEDVIDALVNCAGVYGEQARFEDLSFHDVMNTYRVNAMGPMRMTRALLPWLLRSSDPTVAHITSLMGSITDNTSGGSYGYRMSKAALNMFNKSFAIDHPGITSIVINPGWVKTDMGGSDAPTEVEDSARGILKVIHRTTKIDSGKFFDFEGDELPW